MFVKIGFPYPVVVGCLLLGIGLILFIASVLLFVKIGKGTLAPWKPTQKLVVKGLYQHLRNPMILGVVVILTAESFLLESFYIMCWAFLFFIINNIYFSFKEEPDLIKRFGEEYVAYKNNVPRWLPRTKGWQP
ncbi:MAG: isoprenylcysteine carboxylmethyltransferase family protein [Bacteroidota bacterium]